MGVWMKQIPVKLPLETAERVRVFAKDREIPVGMSTAIRHMVEDFLSRMSSGIVQFAAEQGNRVPSVQSIPGTPSQVSAAFPGEQKKPPVRRVIGDVAGRGRITHFNRKDVANQASSITPFRQLQHIHFTPLNESAA